MPSFGDLPLGFGMALLQNPAAFHRFESMSPQQQRALLARLPSVTSKAEMRALVASLAQDGPADGGAF